MAAGKAMNQAAQDKNAAASGAPVAAARAAAKATSVYRNDEWDLVDAARHHSRDIKAVPAEELPKPMQTMTPVQRETYVAEKAAEREKLQKKIAELAQQRDAYIAKEAKKAKKAKGAASFDDAVTSTIKTEGTKAGLAF
jgi:hypothetical protein